MIPEPITEAQYAAAQRRLDLTPGFRTLTRQRQALAVAERAIASRVLPRPAVSRSVSPYCCDLAERMAERFDLTQVGIGRLREEHPHTPEAIDAADAARKPS